MSKTRMVFYGSLGALVSVLIWSFIGGCHTSSRPLPPTPPAEEPAPEEIVPPAPISQENLIEEGIIAADKPPVAPEPPPAPKEALAVAAAEEAPAPKAAPAVAAAAEAPAPTRVHTVVKGDTLWGISKQYGVTPKAIEEANKLADPGRLSIGQQLVIP